MYVQLAMLATLGILKPSIIYNQIIDELNHRSHMQHATTQQTREMYPILDQCWANDCDTGPTLIQLRIHVSCLGSSAV